MTEFQSMPMFWEVFFADTADLAEDAAKAHLFLIGHAWIRGARLINEDGALSRMARLTPRKWAEVKGAVLALWYQDEEGFWTQKRMRKEFEFVRARVDASRQNGKLGGRPKGVLLHPGIALLPPPIGAHSHTEATFPTGNGKSIVANQCSSESETQDKLAEKANEINESENLDVNSGLTGSNLSTLTLTQEKIEKATLSCPKRVRTKMQYSEKFLEFWRQYPTDANMSKKDASKEFERLSSDDQDKAIVSCKPFRSYCSARPDYRPVHANRYLSQGRFEGHAATAANASKTVFVRMGTPQWSAWDAHYRRTRNQAPPTNKEGNGWHFPADWPPESDGRQN